MECTSISFTEHAYDAMAERQISPVDVVAVVRGGEIISSNPDDLPRPSYLIMGKPKGRPLHVLVSRDESSGTCFVVTTYYPDAERWDRAFRRRVR